MRLLHRTVSYSGTDAQIWDPPALSYLHREHMAGSVVCRVGCSFVRAPLVGSAQEIHLLYLLRFTTAVHISHKNLHIYLLFYYNNNTSSYLSWPPVRVPRDSPPPKLDHGSKRDVRAHIVRSLLLIPSQKLRPSFYLSLLLTVVSQILGHTL